MDCGPAEVVTGNILLAHPEASSTATDSRSLSRIGDPYLHGIGSPKSHFGLASQLRSTPGGRFAGLGRRPRAKMKTAIGLIGLGVAGSVLPAGFPDMTQAAVMVGGTALALALLVAACLTAPILARSRSATTRSKTSPAPFYRAVPRDRSAARLI